MCGKLKMHAVNPIVALAVSPKTASQMLGYGVTHTYKLMKRGELISFLDGGSRRILVSSINDYIQRKVAAGEPERAHRLRSGGPGRGHKKTAAANQPSAA
jgi:hypothetical protein